MLAEKRVKTKWTLNPRGALWSKDDSKKGQQLLQKMGWSKGQGLGKNTTGVVDPLTLRANRGNRGLGMNSSWASDWTEHHESFEALLANLNSGSDSTQPKPPKKLEEKSKSSKTRVQ
ncbi:unnamed protein product [Cyprideis torosa]|uniref:Uncharacterized protein n=1 Tax=Cyprideis torosa TaxID=163714 RepID=A0A7R8WRQ4_9CRUS|nr:unnamed protein product [Cyprideis torosa]CAG0908510.1 unnamed protein product [Cyprideis torosa]